MDYQVAFYQDSWQVQGKANTATVIEQVINTRDAAISRLRLPQGQEGKVDVVSCGIWIKVRTDRPRGEGHVSTAFVSAKENELHRPVPFSYIRGPLEETQIRLLEVLPGAGGEPLRANLVTVNLVDAPAYSALSYIWGSPALQETIVLGGDTSEKQQPILLGVENSKNEHIRASLHAALTQMRQSDTPCFVWADALCINQGDMVERSRQVAIMGTIFSSAAQVIIWLGEATEHSKYGMQTLQFIAQGKAFENDSPWRNHPPELVQKGLIDILSRPWFNRIWTVQEAALSSRRTVMVCDDGSFAEWAAAPISVYLFIRGLKYAAVSLDWVENGLAGSADVGLAGVDLTGLINLLGQQLHQVMRREGFKRPAPEPDLLDIAYEVKDKQSSDPRDRLYGILGLALIRGADTDHQLQPDYSKTVEQVQDDFRQTLLAAAKREPAVWASAERL